MTVDINQLHAEAQTGDQAIKDRLFQQLSVRFQTFTLLRIWNEQDAEEIVQDALMIVAREYEKMEFHTSFSAWAYTVLNNRLLSYFKTKKRESDRDSGPFDETNQNLALPVPEPTLRIKLKDCFGKVRKANQRYARVVVLHYQGFRVDEICKRVDVKRGNLYMILSRARAMLKNCLENGDLKS